METIYRTERLCCRVWPVRGGPYGGVRGGVRYITWEVNIKAISDSVIRCMQNDLDQQIDICICNAINGLSLLFLVFLMIFMQDDF